MEKPGSGSRYRNDLGSASLAAWPLRRLHHGLMVLVPFCIFVPVLFGLHVVADDYYYYERIARHLLEGDGSTFDGVVQTNGYQPLWMPFVMLAVATGNLTGIAAQYVAMAICGLLSIAVLELVRRQWKSTTIALAATLLLAAYLAFFGAMGMEASVLLACGALLFSHLHANGYRLSARAGGLLALCFLARIDSLLYFFPLMTYLWVKEPLRGKVAFAVPVLATVLVYAYLNEHLFGVPFPISGMAKTVQHVTTLHAATWIWLFRGQLDKVMIAGCVLVTCAVLLLVSRRDRVRVSLSGFGVVLFFVLTSLRSDWMIWQWYEFPFALHLILCAFVDVPASRSGIGRAAALGAAALGVLAVLVVGFRNVREAGRQNAVTTAAERIRDLLAHDEHAIVAMGDRAGSVGALLPNRLIQLEGLVMDRAYLDNFYRQRSIVPLLIDYKVDYYIATNPRPQSDGCFITREPDQSQGASFLLLSRICAPVVADFTIAGWHTVVFRISGNSPAAVGAAKKADSLQTD